ncbi:MAG: hypothetical protein LC772_08490 [Chloroflexi bacterium]|nr:hypothetical protein [Chloroflexota bacterium]
MNRTVHKPAAPPAPADNRRQARPPSIVGWNGIYLEVPRDWELKQVAGDMAQGHLRIDGPEGHHIRVKWRKQKKSVDVRKVLDRYLETVKKGSRKSGSVFESNADLKLKIFNEGAKRKPVFFSWRSTEQAIGLIWHCGICDRITIAQIDGPLKKNLTLLANQVLGSLDDHDSDGVNTWGLYGLAAEIPADFYLLRNKLLSGYIHLEFGRRASTIDLDRWGLAEVVLRKDSLEQWVRKQYGKTLRGYRISIEDAEIRGHRGLAVSGELSSIRERVKAAAMQAARLNPVTSLTQFVWQCEETNRICSVLVQHARVEDDLAREIAASYVCHS